MRRIVVKNLSLNYLRREQLKEHTHQTILNNTQKEIEFRISTLESCDPAILFSKEVRSIFENTLADLPEKTRTIFLLSRLEDKSHKEIAQIAGITVKGVDYHVARALKELRVSLKDYLPSVLFLL